jgi:hypothetical protein
VVFCNLCGFGASQGWTKLPGDLSALDAMHADLVGLSKLKVDTLQPAVLTTLRKHVKSQWPHSWMSVTSSPVKSSTQSKAGGTLSLAIGNIVGRVMDHDRDPFGRWTTVTLQGKGPRMVSIREAYV